MLPIEQRLTPLRVFEHAVLPFQAILLALALLSAAAIILWAVQQVRRARSLERTLSFLSGVMVAAPLIGTSLAAYNLMKACIGLANIRPAPEVWILAPSFAESALGLWLGFSAAAVAAVAGTALKTMRPFPEG